MSAATTVPHEFRREISPGRAAIPEAASRLLDLHHQYRSESSGSRLRRWWMQVHPIQLLGHRHKARMDADASWKIDPLSRRIASDRGHTLHHDLFRGSVIESHWIYKLSDYRCIENVLLPYQERRISKEKKDSDTLHKENSTRTCSLLSPTKNVNCQLRDWIVHLTDVWKLLNRRIIFILRKCTPNRVFHS